MEVSLEEGKKEMMSIHTESAADSNQSINQSNTRPTTPMTSRRNGPGETTWERETAWDERPRRSSPGEIAQEKQLTQEGETVITRRDGDVIYQEGLSA